MTDELRPLRQSDAESELERRHLFVVGVPELPVADMVTETDSEQRIQQGELVKCDECGRTRPIITAPAELFGSIVGYGPGGETDQFIEGDGWVVCHWCSKEELEGFDDD